MKKLIIAASPMHQQCQLAHGKEKSMNSIIKKMLLIFVFFICLRCESNNIENNEIKKLTF